jgi:hypothetical protein
MKKDLGIIWNTEKRKVESLNDWEENPRKITDAEFEKLKAGITARGFHDVIKVDADGTILSGHQRKRALNELGVQEVTVIFPNRALSPEERKEVAIESNLHRGSFDFDMLGNNFDVEMLLDLGMTKFQLDLLPKDELVQMDNEGLTKSMDSYLEGNIKQIVLFFKNSDYDDILLRMDKVQAASTTDNHTEAFLFLLNYYETNANINA